MAFLLLLLSITAVAQDAIIRRGCRVGTPRPQGMVSRRGAPTGQTKQAGGDFYYGERHQLTVLVAFNDRSFVGDEAATLEQWNMIFNAENLMEEPFMGSVHDYFLAQSYGDFNVVFDLVYVQVGDDAQKYASTATHDEKSQYLVEDIVEILKQNPEIDWSQYDWNDDGFVNQLLIIYAGQGMNDYDRTKYSDLIWPHQWWMSEHLKDMQQGVYCDPIPVETDGQTYFVDCYCALAELTKNNDYGSFGTICHEYTHCFGFPDFYNGSQQYVGRWDLMDYGNYNGNGFHPCGYSAHERWLMDWLTPEELTTTATITDMPALTDEGCAYLLRNDGYDQEYYIVENRQQRGWDQSLPGNGIVIFHIDYDPELWTSLDEPANGGSVNHYVLFHAGNTSRESAWAYPYQANDSLTNTSTPAATLNNANIDGTKFMSKPITRMTVTDGLASFDFLGGTPSSINPKLSTLNSQLSTFNVLYRLGPVTIVRDENGRVHKIIY